MANSNEAMREALVYAKAILTSWRRDAPLRAWVEYDEAISRARAALALPRRQCDVGTAEEQFKRWQAFCAKYDEDCMGCPCDGDTCASLTSCFSKWAQMPYEEGETDGSK